MRIGYARVSKEEQNLDLQLNALEQNNCDRTFIDKGVSGANRERPGLLECLETLKEGDELYFWDWDRLSRDLYFSGWLRIELEKKGVILFNLNGDDIDEEDPEAYLSAAMKSVIANYERLVLKRRTKAGVQAAKSRGVHTGRRYSLNREQLEQFVEFVRERELKKPNAKTVKSICNIFKISKATYYNLLKDIASGAITDNKLAYDK